MADVHLSEVALERVPFTPAPARVHVAEVALERDVPEVPATVDISSVSIIRGQIYTPGTYFRVNGAWVRHVTKVRWNGEWR